MLLLSSTQVVFFRMYVIPIETRQKESLSLNFALSLYRPMGTTLRPNWRTIGCSVYAGTKMSSGSCARTSNSFGFSLYRNSNTSSGSRIAISFSSREFESEFHTGIFHLNKASLRSYKPSDALTFLEASPSCNAKLSTPSPPAAVMK